MTDEIAAFTRAIIDHPRDRLARLVFADFLEETGDPNHVARAHLIRAQIALDDPDTPADEYDNLKAFEGRLLDLFQETWNLDLPVWLADECDVEYRGGFVEHVALPLRLFAARATELFRTVPLRSLHVRVAAGAPSLGGLFDRLPRLTDVDTLRFGPGSPALTDFVYLDGEQDPPPLYTELMTARTLTGLRVLDLSENRITNHWLVAFVSALPLAAFARTLEVLNLTFCVHLTDAGGNTLATARSLDHLKRLILKDVPLSGATRAMLRRRFGDRVVC
jgi:uncharacterized protein (TIGR02996 family)